MPYENEFAKSRSVKRLAESKKVADLLGSYRISKPPASGAFPADLILPDLSPSAWNPRFIVAIDGSYNEVSVENGFPGAMAAYVTVASVLLDHEKLIDADTHRPVDPQVFRKLEKADSIDCALPGCNVVAENEDSASASLRRKIFEVFSQTRLFDEGETLLETYEALLAHKPVDSSGKEPFCPYGDDCLDTNSRYRNGVGCYACPCGKRDVFSTDALRFHEGMNPIGSNGAMFAEIMQVLERVWLIHVLRYIEQRKIFFILGDIAFVLDGPLALFGHPAWLSQSIYKELSRLNKKVRESGYEKDLLIVGVEKSGLFVDHFEHLDQNKDGNSGNFPSQQVALLTDDYIKQHIIFSNSDRLYGRQSYFGRKFFYKTKTGAKVVATVPFFTEDHRDLRRADMSQYPRIEDALGLLDQVVSVQYANSISPLISAHAEAAIPLNLGKRILEQLAKQIIQENS